MKATHRKKNLLYQIDNNLKGTEVDSNSLTFGQGGMEATLNKLKLSDLQTRWTQAHIFGPPRL